MQSGQDANFENKEGRIQFCQDCMDKGYLDLAVRELGKGLNYYPDDPDLHFCMGVALDAQGEREQAIFVGLWVPSIHSLGTLVLTGERDRA